MNPCYPVRRHGWRSTDENVVFRNRPGLPRQVVARTLESSSAEERTDWGVMKEKIRTDLRRFLTKQTFRCPLIMPVILEI
jgi:mRNA degradation ribonuclease J1/J2